MTIHHVTAGYQASKTLLQERTILITGAGDGIGRAAALACASHGATVILLGRTEEKLECVYDEILAAGGAEPAIVPLDLATAGEAEVQQLAETLAEHFGALHGLLHNASILGERKPLAQARLATWQSVLQVNVTAGFLLTQALLPLLEAADDASVLFTSSGVGRQGRAYWGAYAVSKFATEGLCQVWAAELANTSRVRVNVINPGATNTAMRRTAYPAEPPTTNPAPEALMPSYLYLLGPDSRNMTGCSFDAQPIS